MNELQVFPCLLNIRKVPHHGLIVLLTNIYRILLFSEIILPDSECKEN